MPLSGSLSFVSRNALSSSSSSVFCHSFRSTSTRSWQSCRLPRATLVPAPFTRSLHASAAQFAQASPPTQSTAAAKQPPPPPSQDTQATSSSPSTQPGSSPETDPSQIDWAKSFHGLSTVPFSKEASDLLQAEILAGDVEIKPDGIVYLPEIKYRRILNKAFGPGGWGLAPRSETIVTDKAVTREYALLVHGRYAFAARRTENATNKLKARIYLARRTGLLQ